MKEYTVIVEGRGGDEYWGDEFAAVLVYTVAPSAAEAKLKAEEIAESKAVRYGPRFFSAVAVFDGFLVESTE